jgi:hypothetical protein
MKGRGYLKVRGVGERIILKWMLKIQNVRVWTEIKWLKIGSSCGPLLTQ